jgi:putative acetyltransferase
MLWRNAWASANPQIDSVAEPAHWLARIDAEFGPPCETFLLDAPDAEQPIAFLVLQPWHAYIAQLFVDPRHQSAGLGRQLLAFARARTPQGGWLHVAEDNLRARSFYERNGLVAGAESLHPTSGRRRVAYHWGTETDARHTPR